MTHKPDSSSSAGDMLFGMGGKLLYALTRVALPPLALAHMGLADYGLWTACFVLVGYLGMAASGFSLVYLRGTAEHHARGDIAAISRLLSTGILSMGALALALLGALWLAMPALLALFNVAPAERELAGQLWLGATAVFLADMSIGAFANVLHAVGRLRQEQKTWVAAFLLEAVLIFVLLQAGWGVRGLLAAFAGRYLFSATANAWLAWRALPGLRLSRRLFDAGLLRRFFGYGAGMQAAGLLATALHSADRLLAGALIGPAATAVVDLAAKLPTTAGSLASSVSSVAVTASARHDVQGQDLALRRVYLDASRITVASLALCLPFLACFAEPLTLAWLGAGTAQATVGPLMALLVLGLHAHLLTGPITAVSRGRGQLGTDFVYHGLRLAALALALLVASQLLAAGRWPLQALAQALVAAQLVAAALLLAGAHRRLCGSFAGLGRGLLAPTLLAYALAAGLAALLTQGWPLPTGTERLALLGWLLLPLLLWGLLAGPLLAALLLTRAERQRLIDRLPTPYRWSRA